MNELDGNRVLHFCVCVCVCVHLEQSRLWFATSVAQMQTRPECGGTLCGMCVSEAVCRALCCRGLFYVAVCPVYVLLPLLCALH